MIYSQFTFKFNPRKRMLIDFDVNIKSIILGYITGGMGGDLDIMEVLLDLPNGRNLSW